MIATLSLFLWVAGFYLVIRYRVHIHVTYSNHADAAPVRSRRGKAARSVAPASPVVPDDSEVGKPAGDPDVPAHRHELEQALTGLGCKKLKARQVAEKVASQGGDFDSMLRTAIREAA
jgi:hypothetical protein